MNRDFDELPASCEVLVVGAGPAGSATARLLAREAVDVVLVDQHAFPRDKTCGDGLMPDAHAALSRLGVLDDVLPHARVATQVGLIGPRGGRLEITSTLAVIPRRELDERLCRAAVQAGARMHAPARFVAPVLDSAGHVTGACLEHRGQRRTVSARHVVLATGAAAPALLASGLCRRRRPSGMAMRTYVSAPGTRLVNGLEVIWHPRLRGGYGWVFPAPGGRFNIGVGWFHRADDAPEAEGDRGIGLHQRFQALCDVHAGARELLASDTRIGGFKGAPLRCTLQGADFGRPGLMLAGEAAGTTYSLTGEGIGKALESGILAAEAILEAGRSRIGDEQAHLHYVQHMEALKPRFRLYEQANSVNAHPWLADLVIWRGNRSARLRDRMSAVLGETSTPGSLLTWRGMRRLVMG